VQVDQRAREVVLMSLADAGLAAVELDERRIAVTLSGEHKRSIAVLIEVGERTVRVSSPFSVKPDERHDEVYRILLTRNLTSGPVHFALSDDDLVIVGSVPVVGLDGARFDELMGRLLNLADDTFDQVLRSGFATYLAYEQRWRAKVGLPPNPVG